MGAQPLPLGRGIARQQTRDGRMEGGAVIHVQPVRHLVRDGGLQHFRRSKDQAPAVADVARRRATAPP